jgi:AcrR family transcriptional regulator
MTNLTERLPSTLAVRTEPVQLRSAERISKLLDAAAELIDEHGIDGLTTSDVAVRSGSSVGVVYRYFPNIQSLLRGLAARNMDLFTSRIFGSMTESSDDWMVAMNSTIDTYIDLVRTEPGFRAIGFGDVIAKRFLQPDVSNNTVLATEFANLFVEKYGLVPSEELSLDLEIVIEIADALLTRAFLYEKDGDARFVAKLREIVYGYMSPHANAVAQ